MNGYKIFFESGASTIIEADRYEITEKNHIVFYRYDNTNAEYTGSPEIKFVADFNLNIIAGYHLFRETRKSI